MRIGLQGAKVSSGSGPGFYFGLVCEGPGDERTVQLLTRRVYEREVEWLEDNFDSVIGWTGVEQGSDYTRWSGASGVKQLAKQRRIKVHGRFSGETWRGEARQATKAIRLFMDEIRRRGDDFGLILVVLSRDTDDRGMRRQGLRKAREESSAPFEIVLAVAHPKRESWILSAMSLKDEDGQERLDALRKELGFDPTLEAHKLTASTSGAKRDAKRVLDELLASPTDSVRRKREVLQAASLSRLHKRGKDTGLAEFLGELSQRKPDELGE